MKTPMGFLTCLVVACCAGALAGCGDGPVVLGDNDGGTGAKAGSMVTGSTGGTTGSMATGGTGGGTTGSMTTGSTGGTTGSMATGGAGGGTTGSMATGGNGGAGGSMGGAGGSGGRDGGPSCEWDCQLENEKRCAGHSMQTCMMTPGGCLRWTNAQCPMGQTCNSDATKCVGSTMACMLPSECTCGCTCTQMMTCGNCTGAVPPSCMIDNDCGPVCSGLTCVMGKCKQTL